MRYIYWLIFTFCFTPLSVAEPYTAAITADGTVVRSGPGDEFYPTSQLQTGNKVEVHYEQGKWYAIRPPIGSFSWVSAQFVDLGSNNIGTVLAEGLASRIGSDFSDDCDTVQVALKKGEPVLVLERREMPENSASPVWLKIAPPSGEFRWIHRSALGESVRQVRYDTTDTDIPKLPKINSLERSIPAIPSPKMASARPIVADSFQRAFREFQQEAYTVITRPAEDEIFAALIQQAEELHQAAVTDQDLEKTYHLLEFLQRTRMVRRELALRRPAAAGTNQGFAFPNSKPSAINSGAPLPRQSIVPAYTPTAAQTVPLRAGINVGGYDIVGWLGEFESPPKGHPPYAVVETNDEKGQIICLISPSANLDLSAYVGQFVGINGVLGYYEKQQGKPPTRHITTRNIQILR